MIEAAIACCVLGVDLGVQAVQLTQGFQGGTTPLVGGRATMARAQVRVTGASAPVAGVDAVLRVFADGIELDGSPFRSVNGPISAPLTPTYAQLDSTVNFLFVAPVSDDIDLVVTVNPTGNVAESSLDNNRLSLLDRQFLCRTVLDCAYLPVNYTPGGGLPSATMTDPGAGDAFLRGIYPLGEWNYHRSPTPTLTWTTDINSSNGTLLNELLDILNADIPGLGYLKPTFLYAWLPGNPFSGNGQANGAPGSVAFGNTESSRFQRTFAHEIGHCWGLPHVTTTIGQPSVDVEYLLKQPLSLPQLHASTQSDVMVAGLLTNQAWVGSNTYNDCLSDSRSECLSPLAGGDGGGASAADSERCLRVRGTFLHSPRALQLEHSTIFDEVRATPSRPDGDVVLTAFANSGARVWRTAVRTDTTRESCASEPGAKPVLLEGTPFWVTVPATPGGEAVTRIEVRERRSGALLAWQQASASAPQVTALDAQVEGDMLSVRWDGRDADGDPLEATLQYSPDGGNRWVTLAASTEERGIRASLREIPASRAGAGLVRARVTDGMRTTDAETAILGMEGGVAAGSNPPAVHIIAPHAGLSFLQWAPVILHASGWDLEDRLLPDASLDWVSSLQGSLGSGRVLPVAFSVPGTHLITLTGTDIDGNAVVDTVSVAVTARAQVDADINNDGATDGIDLSILLANWGASGIGAGDMDFDDDVDGADLGLWLSSWETTGP